MGVDGRIILMNRKEIKFEVVNCLHVAQDKNRIFLFTTASRTALGPTQTPIQWVAGALYLGVKRPGLEADHSPPSSAEVNECVELCLQFPNTPLWRGSQ
jgi:hypothetical protein